MASLECTYSGELNHYQLLEIRGINLSHSPQHKCHSKHLIDQVRRTSAFIDARLTASYLGIIEVRTSIFLYSIQQSDAIQCKSRFLHVGAQADDFRDPYSDGHLPLLPKLVP